MTRGAGSTSRAVKKPSRKATRPERAPKTARTSTPSIPVIDDLKEQLEVRTRDLNEALEQRAATAQVLRIVSKFPGEPEPVFRAILDNATRICAAHYGALFKYEDGASSRPRTSCMLRTYTKTLTVCVPKTSSAAIQ